MSFVNGVQSHLHAVLEMDSFVGAFLVAVSESFHAFTLRFSQDTIYGVDSYKTRTRSVTKRLLKLFRIIGMHLYPGLPEAVQTRAAQSGGKAS